MGQVTIRIEKLEELPDANFPGNIPVGYFRVGTLDNYYFQPPTIGRRFWIDGYWSTSGVQEILSPNTFRTHNSVYKWEVLGDSPTEEQGSCSSATEKVVVGDIVELFETGDYDVLIHGANCQSTMASGVAKAIVDRWPQVLVKDKEYAKVPKLGGYSLSIEEEGWIVNAYTQEFYGYDGQRYVSYDAIDKAFALIANDLPDHWRIIYPKIGSERGGGSWEIISSIINHHLKDFDRTLVVYNK